MPAHFHQLCHRAAVRIQDAEPESRYVLRERNEKIRVITAYAG